MRTRVERTTKRSPAKSPHRTPDVVRSSGPATTGNTPAHHRFDAVSIAPTPAVTAPSNAPIQRWPFGKKKDIHEHWSDDEVGQYTDSNVTTVKKGAASGAINTVDMVKYNQPIGRRNTGFFKPDVQGGDVGTAAEGTGVDPSDPRLANRAVATSRVADKLGTDVVAKTVFATHDGKQGTVGERAPGVPLYNKEDLPVHRTMAQEIDKDPSLYLADPKTGLDPFGSPAKYYKDPTTGEYMQKDAVTKGNQIDFANTTTQKGMNELQWFDALSGQVDRHGANIFVDPKTGKVTGIDHDAAWGTVGDPNMLKERHEGKFGPGGSHNVGLPSIIDTETAERYKKMSAKDLRRELGDLASPDEIKAAEQRLEAIKQHIKVLEKEGKVIGAKKGQFKEWGAETFDAEKGNRESYLGRSVQHLESMRQQGNVNPKEGDDPTMVALAKSHAWNKARGLYDADAPVPRPPVDPAMEGLMTSYNANVDSGLMSPNDGPEKNRPKTEASRERRRDEIEQKKQLDARMNPAMKRKLQNA